MGSGRKQAGLSKGYRKDSCGDGVALYLDLGGGCVNRDVR